MTDKSVLASFGRACARVYLSAAMDVYHGLNADSELRDLCSHEAGVAAVEAFGRIAGEPNPRNRLAQIEALVYPPEGQDD